MPVEIHSKSSRNFNEIPIEINQKFSLNSIEINYNKIQMEIHWRSS